MYTKEHKVRAFQLLFMNHLNFVAELKQLREKHVQSYSSVAGWSYRVCEKRCPVMRTNEELN
jgi:hypothetical protein